MSDLETAFATLGEPVTIEEVAELVEAGRTVWSWGYGDSESEFDPLDEDDLWFIYESPEDANIAWGPFRVER